jgi:hypothetical protein
MFMMIIVSLLLFWLPALGPLIAGYVGGKTAGGVMRGIVAAILPALAVGAVIWGGAGAINLPLIGGLFAGAASLILMLHSLGLIAGAFIGGAVS